MSQNLELLTSFDRNKDSSIDFSEMDEAAMKAIEWADAVKVAGSKWYLSKGAASEGPIGWKQIEAAGAKNPRVFINLENSPYWLPYEVVALAVRSLA